eukprot:6312214-Amphidinium_carterae.1
MAAKRPRALAESDRSPCTACEGVLLQPGEKPTPRPPYKHSARSEQFCSSCLGPSENGCAAQGLACATCMSRPRRGRLTFALVDTVGSVQFMSLESVGVVIAVAVVDDATAMMKKMAMQFQ